MVKLLFHTSTLNQGKKPYLEVKLGKGMPVPRRNEHVKCEHAEFVAKSMHQTETGAHFQVMDVLHVIDKEQAFVEVRLLSLIDIRLIMQERQKGPAIIKPLGQN